MKQYTADFKKMIAEYHQQGKRVIDLANDYDVPVKTMEKWFTKANKGIEIKGRVNDLALVRAENLRLRQENETLVKALSILAKRGMS